MGVLKAGLIGEHISQTRLPAALEIMCKARGMSLDFELIDAAQMPGFDFVAQVDELRALGWTGVTVTHPWKTHAAIYAGDGMLTGLRDLGAANTLVFEPKPIGHNTDYTGFCNAWVTHMTQDPGIVAMAGAGGVARALGPALAQLGATDIAIWDLDFARAQDLARRIGGVARAIPLANSEDAIRQADGLVNATPLGMREYPGSAFPRHTLGTQNWAFDAVYTPTNTPFLQDAARAGLCLLSGFRLFQHMALGSFAAYTGIDLTAKDYLQRLDVLKPD